MVDDFAETVLGIGRRQPSLRRVQYDLGATMGTTDRNIALEALEALSESGIDWAFLHGLDQVTSGAALSDIDIAVASSPKGAASRLFDELSARSLRPLIVWPYDRTAASTFIVREDLSGGVQLDMLIDPDGTGKYGFRTPPAISARVVGPGLPAIAPSDSYLYSVRKRQLKQQNQRLTQLLAEPPTSREDLTERSKALFATPHGDIVRALLAGHTPPATSQPRWRTAPRLFQRIISPAGAWVHLTGPHGATVSATLAERLRPVLPLVDSMDNSHAAVTQRLPFIGPHPEVRWRAGIVISYGGRGDGATVRLEAVPSQTEMAQTLTSVLAVRAERHLARWLARRSH